MADPFWIYIVIPLLSGLVGYGTNVLAVIMTFQPLEFAPLKVWQVPGQPWGLFGWQGIIPAKAVEMTEILCDVFMKKVIDVNEIFGRLDPKHIASLTQGKMQAITRQLVDKIARSQMPDVWSAISHPIKEDIIRSALDDSEQFITMLMSALQAEILDIIDLRGLMARIVAADKQILCDMFLRTGGAEFDFIRRSGFYFGFLFGLFQALVYFFYKGKWILPVAGFMVGYLTNWVALKLIFEPARPVSFGCYTLQGLFLKRQQEAAGIIAANTMQFFLVQEKLWGEIFHGARRDQWRALLARVTEAFVRQQVEKNMQRRVAAAMLVGEQRMQKILQVTTEHISESLPDLLPCTYAYMEDAMDVETTIREALQVMPPDDFIGILRPAFQQDEWKLILVGGILGATAGAVQQFALFDVVL